MPLDLIPEQPSALWVIGRLERSRPELVETWRERGYRVRSINYELSGKAAEHDPAHAFQAHRITVIFEDKMATESGRWVADLTLGKKNRKPRIEQLRWIPTDGPARTIIRPP